MTSGTRWRVTGVLLLVALGLAACGTAPRTKRSSLVETGGLGALVSGEEPVPRIEPLRPANARAYTVLGRTYFPMTDFAPYREIGVASWYGRQFHGQPTATGERYDMYSFTAAHKTLPLPSYARVTNLSNGRQVIVRVNDRGPFVSDRLIDLSFAAADRLGFVNQGTTSVEVELILPEEIRQAEARGEVIRARGAEAGPALVLARMLSARLQGEERTSSSRNDEPIVSMSSAAPGSALEQSESSKAVVAMEPLEPVSDERRSPAPGYYLQLGAFALADNADSFRRHAATLLPEVDLHVIPATDKIRVWVGPFADEAAARAAARIVTARLGGSAFLVTAP